MIATFVMKPDHAISGSDRTYEGIAVGRHGDTGFLGRAEGHLFGLAIGKALAPDVSLISLRGRDVDKPAVNGPGP